MWKVIDQNCYYSKNLYNYANYIIRQEFINEGRWIHYQELQKTLKESEPYKQLMSQPSQCVLQALDRNWRSYFETIKDWKNHKEKYLGMPRLPKYKKKNGRFPWFIKNNCAYIKENGDLHFLVKRLNTYNWITKAKGRLISIRFIPMGINYKMEVITEIEVSDIQDYKSKRVCSIDLGVNNFATVTNNIGIKPIIINGKGIKSYNQYYNKRKAKIQSEVMKRNNKYWSKQLDSINFKRSNVIKNFMHHASKEVINYCIDNNIDTLVCGHNDTWKQNSNMGKRNNQKFLYIPYNIFIQQLKYKCQNNGIKFITINESYTSGTSFLDEEMPIKENYNKSRRIKRGLFQGQNSLVNSDVNGSLQIMRKAFSNTISYEIEGVLNPIVINVVKFTA